jgi:hypothetical protein
MHRLAALLIALPVVLAACRPPEAPEEFDDLVVYLYERHADDNLATMEVGVDALIQWVVAQEDLENQYEISPLSEEAVDALDEVDRSAVEMVGLAVMTQSDYSVDDAAHAMIAADIDDVYADTFVEYERQWDGDGQCFLDHDCERVEAQENYEAHYPFNIITIAESWNQYVWVEADAGTTFVQRNWQVVPPTVNQAFMEVDEQMYLNLFVPREGGGFWRLQATWMIVTQDSVEDWVALNATGGSMRDNSETLDAYLETL